MKEPLGGPPASCRTPSPAAQGGRGRRSAPGRSDGGTIQHSGERVQVSDALEVVNRNPLVERVLAAGARTVRDRRHLLEAPEGVAVINEWLRPCRQRPSP